MGFRGRGLFEQILMGSFLELMNFYILFKFLFFGSFGQLEWGVFMWSFDFGWLGDFEEGPVDG